MCSYIQIKVTPQIYYVNKSITYHHLKGFREIENLEEYTGLKCLFLENNSITEIKGNVTAG